MTTNPIENDIISRWNNQSYFVHFKNRNRNDCSTYNLEYVTLKEALQNFDVWEVDLDFEMSSEQIKIFKSKTWRSKVDFRQNGEAFLKS